MPGYANAVKADIDRWVEAGLIDPPTGLRLAAHVDANPRRGFSFGSVLAAMAALLVAAALLLFVSANWEEIPRIARVVGLFAVILIGYVGGAIVKGRGYLGFGEALYLIGSVGFGASIALISQMYHISGDERTAILFWCAGTMLAAAALRSPLLTVASVVLAVVWFIWGFFTTDWYVDWWFLLLGGVIWIISLWSDSVASRHLLILSLVMFGALVGVAGDPVVVGSIMALLSAAIFLLAVFTPDLIERLSRLGGPYPVYPLIGFLTGIALLQSEYSNSFAAMLVISSAALGGIVAALVLRGHQSRLMRWTAYAAFVAELCFIYGITIGTMVETSVLFLAFGLLLAAVAWVITRFEKRLAGGA